MTVARAAALAALVLAAALVAVVLLGDGGGRQYRLVFENDGQLVRGNDVQIGGRRVGNVDDIQLTDDNRAAVTITVDEPYAPLHEGTKATIRLASLSSVANRYISLEPGPNNAPELEEGATLDVETASVVDIDQLFNTLDEETREGLADLIQGSADQYAGRTREIARAARYFSPFLSSTRELVEDLSRDTAMLEQALVSTARVMGAVSARRDELTALIGSLNTMMGAIARENAGLAQALGELPGALREANTTFVDLRNALDDLDLLVDEAKPATRELDRFFRELRPLVNAATPTFVDLSRFVRADGPNNDVTDIVRQLPRLQQLGSPAFRSSIGAMRKGQPVVDFFRPYTPELVGWLRNFGQATANYDANGHYARALPIFGAFRYVAGGDGTSRLVPVSPAQRFEGISGDARRRCPGGASEPRPDGSSPWLHAAGDCDPSHSVGVAR